MKLPDKLYDILKWVTMIVLPALATAYVGLAAIWSWPYADEIAKTTAVICTLLGALLGISTAEYNKAKSDADLKPYQFKHEGK
ncbi:MAG: phage holin [Oscillospiraceae bacterium]|nr:phage holin [Oscillospiraceae bacterium]